MMATKIMQVLKHSLLNAIGTDRVSLHSAEPDENGSNEISSTSYSRQIASFSTANGGEIALQSDCEFSLSAGDSVQWVGYWNDGTFLMAQTVEQADFSAAGKYTLKAITTVIAI
ncbi:phage tail fiber protein [Shewanella algae]|uniref:phage tail fiber protein n=1 Tax=Shewanella algae TaxID=38313 RepID=UPI001AACEA14|nr:hypothetical protein [Shewanella algae]MBO2563809.1 hypothetical protein [Shewanella algae]